MAKLSKPSLQRRAVFSRWSCIGSAASAAARVNYWGDMVNELLDEPNGERVSLRHALALGCELDDRYRAMILEPQDADITTALASVRSSRARCVSTHRSQRRGRRRLLVFLGPQVDWTIFCDHLAREWQVEHRVGVGELHGIDELGVSIKEASLVSRPLVTTESRVRDLGLLGRVPLGDGCQSSGEHRLAVDRCARRIRLAPSIRPRWHTQSVLRHTTVRSTRLLELSMSTRTRSNIGFDA